MTAKAKARRAGSAQAKAPRITSTEALEQHRATRQARQHKRRVRNRAMRLVIGLVIVAGTLCLMAVLLFPWQSLSNQRRSIAHAEDTLTRLQTETESLQTQIDQARDPVVVERIAREQLSLVREGDTLYRLSVDPSDVVNLPEGWPLPGVAHLLAGR